MIPEAAVIEGARAISGVDFSAYPDPSFRIARAILEAAAPQMLAGAWVEGAQAGFESTSEGFNGECAFDHCAPDDYPPTNPYSGEKWEVQDYQL